jgi:RND family efflux transporter MFP subunit
MKKLTLLFLALAMMLIQCSRHEDHEKSASDHDHDHEEIRLLVTAYSDRTELFAETGPWVVGESCPILAHFTNLSDFKPLKEGKVRISLTVGSERVEAEAEAPVRPGIYQLSLTPKTAGTGRLGFEIGDGSQIDAGSVEVFSTHHEAHHHHESPPASPQAVVFTKESAWKVDFATGLPRKGELGTLIRTSARIQSAQGDEVVLTAKAGGIIRFSGENTLEGKYLSAGQPIFSIAGGGMADNNMAVRYAEAQNNYERAKADYLRAKNLAEDRIVSQKELSLSRNEHDNAKAVFENLHRHFKSDSQVVTSPFDGFIKQIFVRNGQYLAAGEPIVSVSQNQKLLLRADVRPRYAPQLESVVSATLRTLHDNRVYTLEELNGRLISIGRSLNEENFLIPVSLQIDKIGGLLPGGFVELTLKTAPRSESLSVPSEALLEDQGKHFVFVQITPELFEKRWVSIGDSDALQTEILDGLDETDRLVISGAIWVKLAQASGTLDAHAGHVH